MEVRNVTGFSELPYVRLEELHTSNEKLVLEEREHVIYLPDYTSTQNRRRCHILTCQKAHAYGLVLRTAHLGHEGFTRRGHSVEEPEKKSAVGSEASDEGGRHTFRGECCDRGSTFGWLIGTDGDS